jgi:predicted RNase H-like HicB family nuclease
VGLEEGADGAFIAHPLVPAGCVGVGDTAEAAVTDFTQEWGRWLRFLASTGDPVPPANAELEVAVDEWLRTHARVATGESAVCFAADMRPLALEERERGLRLLGDLRGRVLAQVRRRTRAEWEADLERETAGGWTVRRVLEELARGQWWTLSRLGASPMAGAPDYTIARLDTALALTIQHLGHLADQLHESVLELDGEEWTARKVLRRLLWLEWTLGGAAARALDSTGTTG